VGSFGERLRREREMRGISLDEIATATKISARNLRALEDEKFQQLPGGIFNKGFVRAYAKFLGIDEEDIVAQYETASHETEAAREQKLQEEFSKAEFRKPKRNDSEISLEPKSQWGTIAAIVLIAALAYGGYNYYQRRRLEKLQQSQPTTVVSPAPVLPPSNTPTGSNTPNSVPSLGNSTSQPTETSATQHANEPKSEPARAATQKSAAAAEQTVTPTNATAENDSATPIELKIKVNRESWVYIKADGKTLVSTTLQPGVERSFKATDKIEMVIGNAGGVEVSYNGKLVDNLNNAQDVRKIIFTANGYQ
jgi:cytoskeleton protein RodZ